MAVKTINESPTLTDTIQFILKTPKADGCLDNPYKVNSITIYFIERDFTNSSLFEYELKKYDPTKLDQAQEDEQTACDFPTPENITKAQNSRTVAEASIVASKFYYNEALPVATIGTALDPAWLSTDTENAFITNIGIGEFELLWEPKSQREGQYFICWTWTPNIAGDSLSELQYFEIFANLNVSTSPNHKTKEGKYETLLEKYTPGVFKTRLGEGDLSANVLTRFHKAIAKGFTVVEDFAVQLIDLLDANIANENCLALLANMFDLQLKSDDPTLWRRQIKRSIPLYKKKGTLGGLREALSNAGITLSKLTRLWQIISSSTWVEALSVNANGQTEFTLSRNPILPIDTDNFELSLRPHDEDEFVDLTQEYVTFDGATMTWVGGELSSPIYLVEGDTLKITYQINEVLDQDVENYIRSLPLADQRDDRDQLYPLKNWNVRVIEEDDPVFDVIIPTRHPYENPVIFGKVRTEFPFSENIYNMEEWNGSLRDSTKPCDIDRDFVDCCSACLSSKFTIDLEIDELSDQRLVEASNIINEYKPFHAILHSMNVSGMFEEFINCNNESVEFLVSYDHSENIISGQTIFSRFMQHASSPGNDENAIRRNMLNDMTIESVSVAGTASSEEIVLYVPYTNILGHGSINNEAWLVDPETYIPGDNNNVLEILAPSANAGNYVVSGAVDEHAVRIDQGSPDTIPEPLSYSEFTFNLSNIVYSNAVNDITVTDVAVVDITDPSITDIKNFVKIGDYVVFGGNQYMVTGYVEGELKQLYIDYSGPNTATSIDVYRRILDNEIGFVGYRGLKLVAVGDYETSLSIINDSSTYEGPDDDHFRENYMIRIDDGMTTYYFTIRDIDGNSPPGSTTFILDGEAQTWPTTGTGTIFSIYRATKLAFTVPEQNEPDGPGHAFESPVGGGPPQDGYRRTGADIVTIDTEVVMPMYLRALALNSVNKNQVVEAINQEESISFSIEWSDGSKEEGTL